MAKIEAWLSCDLKKPVQVQGLSGNVFSMDNNGSRINVRIYDNGEKTTVSGSVTANCILADGSTINVNGSLTTDNGQSVAYVDIPQSCLLVPGPIRIAIKLTASGVITTLAAVVTTVYRTQTDIVITPSAQIITDWNAEISAAIATQNATIANQDTKINDLKSALGANTDNIWVGNPSYSFTRRASITGISIPAGTYTISAIITTPDQTATESEVVFVNASAQDIVKVQLDRNYQAYKTFTLTEEAKALYLYSVHKNDSTGITGTWSNIMLFAGEVREDYNPVFSAKDFVARNKNTKQDDVISGYINLFNPDDTDIVTGSFISKIQNGEETWNTLATVGETGYIPVNTGDRIIRLRSYNKTDCELDDNNPIACYD